MIKKESNAWFHLAEVFDRNDGGHEYLCAFTSSSSLYSAFGTPESNFRRRVDDAILCNMNNRITAHLDSVSCQAYMPDNKFINVPSDDMTEQEKRDARVLACLMFGWEAKSEGR
jgi:hypothetical protein